MNARHLVALAAVLVGGCTRGSSTHPATDSLKAVAITVDDVPGVAFPPRVLEHADSLVAANRRLVAHLNAFGVPSTAFVVPGRACAEGECELLNRVLDVWLEAGHDLANHTLTHRTLNRTSAAWQIEDITAASDVIQKALDRYGKRLKYFRHPGLHAGDTEAKRDSIEAYLQSVEMEVGPVTIDNDEWIFAHAYRNAMANDDTAGMDRVGAAYLDYMDRVFAFYEQLSADFVGRQIPQILLIHDNALNAEYLDELLGAIQERGYRFVTLDEAMQDSVYRRGNPYVGPRGLSWLQRWRVGEGLETLREPGFQGWVHEMAGM